MKYINCDRVLFVSRDIAGAYGYLDALELQNLCTITIPAIDNSLADTVVAYLDAIVLNLHITQELNDEVDLIERSAMLSQLPVAILLPYCERALDRYIEQYQQPVFDYTTSPTSFAQTFKQSMTNSAHTTRQFQTLQQGGIV